MIHVRFGTKTEIPGIIKEHHNITSLFSYIYLQFQLKTQVKTASRIKQTALSAEK
jgi:hypothetical protein